MVDGELRDCPGQGRWGAWRLECALLYKFSERVAIGDPDGKVLITYQCKVAFHTCNVVAVDDIGVMDPDKMGR